MTSADCSHADSSPPCSSFAGFSSADPAAAGFASDRARELVVLAAARGVQLRVLGGVAIALRASAQTPRALLRASNDLDFAVAEGKGRRAGEVLLSSGLVAPSERFNALHGHRRLVFVDAGESSTSDEGEKREGPQSERPTGEHAKVERAKVDVFVGDLEMCHVVPLRGRLEHDPLTLAPTDLLLSKGQIVRLAAKDRLDIYCLLWNEEVDAAYIAALCARDWGWWRTLSANLDVCLRALPETVLPDADRARIGGRLAALAQTIEAAPKSLRWRARSRVGDRVRWYEEPEEIERPTATGTPAAEDEPAAAPPGESS